MSDDAVKLMYFAPLVEGRSRSAFRDRWLRHGALAMDMPTWTERMTRYVFFHAVTADDIGEIPAGLGDTHEARYGGVGAAWVRSMADLQALQRQDLSGILADEEEAFGRRLGSDLWLMREHVFIDVEPPTYTLVGAVHRTEGLSFAEFRDAWLAYSKDFVATRAYTDLLCSYVQNHAVEGSAGVDGITELGFRSLDDVRAFCDLMAEPGSTGASFIDYSRALRVLAVPQVLYP